MHDATFEFPFRKTIDMADLVRTQGLSKHFGGLVAVNQVDFHVTEGQVAGIIGPNGSGKTTFFNLLSGFFPPTEGIVQFQGKDVTRLLPHKRVEMGMARTFQLVSVFDSLTAWENLVLSTIKFKKEQHSLHNFFFSPAQKKAVLKDCQAALKMVGLEDKGSTPTSELSYGDKRMLEISIGLSLKPKLLLLDEPLAGLSDHEIGEVLHLIHRVKDSFTLIIIEHKISKIVDLVSRLSVMNYGRIICEGDPNDVLCDPEVRECYWGKEEDTCST
jgi:branched-chain amino acid transport system ATP-binding protein